ncbi:MAG: hypothetical protein WCA01_08305 [Burkholderiales bacterium]
MIIELPLTKSTMPARRGSTAATDSAAWANAAEQIKARPNAVALAANLQGRIGVDSTSRTIAESVGRDQARFRAGRFP